MTSKRINLSGFLHGQRRAALVFLLVWSGFAAFEVASDWVTFDRAGWSFSLAHHAAQAGFIFFPWFLVSLGIGMIALSRPDYFENLGGYVIHVAIAVAISLAHLLIIVASFWIFFPGILVRSSLADLFVEQFLNWFHFELLVYFAILLSWRFILHRHPVGDEGRRSLRQQIVGRIDGEVHFAAPDDIDWIESANNYALAHAGKRSIRVRETLKSLASRLDPQGFVRVHRSALVNVDRIDHMEGRELVMRNGARVSCSRAGKRALRQQRKLNE